jgi:hypothetical protein
MVRAKRIAKKVEALPPGILQRGFTLVDRQPDLGPANTIARIQSNQLKPLLD